MSARATLAALAVALLGASCAEAQDAPNADMQAAGVQGAADLHRGGAALFEEKCAMCHREANMVTGMGTFIIAARDPNGDPVLENRDILTPDYVALAIRSGIGNMPRISRAEVSDAQLAEISEYLVAAAAGEGDGQ